MRDNHLLSVIIRFHNPERLPLLDEAIFSLALQFWPTVEVVVVLQNGTPQLEDQVRELIEQQPWRSTPRRQVFSVAFPPEVDGRSTLLNRGMTQAEGRYLAFLDDDDYVYQHGYRNLIEGLEKSGAALAAGGCRVARTRRGNGHWFTYRKLTPFNWAKTQEDLFVENFIPIHSYVIDRARVAAEDLWFDDQLPPLEDYDFLLRLAAKYRFDLSQYTTPVCEYRYHDENSLQHDQHGEPLMTPKIERARALIEARKGGLTVTLPVRELLLLRQQTAPPPAPTNQELLIELLTKQQRTLNRLVDKIYAFAHRRAGLLALLVKAARLTKRIRAAMRRLFGFTHGTANN